MKGERYRRFQKPRPRYTSNNISSLQNSGPWIWMLLEMRSISLPLYVDPLWSNVAWFLCRILKPFLFHGTIGEALADFRQSFYASSSSVLLGVSPISSRLQFHNCRRLLGSRQGIWGKNQQHPRSYCKIQNKINKTTSSSPKSLPIIIMLHTISQNHQSLALCRANFSKWLKQCRERRLFIYKDSRF